MGKLMLKKIWFPIKALIIKEILAVWRDKKSRITLIVPPLIQLVILTQAATLDVNNISIGLYNEDMGWYSHELTQRIKGSPYFKHVYDYKDYSKIREILDWRKSNASQIVLGYLNLIFQSFNRDILKLQGIDTPEKINIEFRAFFNPNIEYIYYTVPSLVAILSMILALTVTAMSVSRERENG